jgi:hypothetical protein
MLREHETAAQKDRENLCLVFLLIPEVAGHDQVAGLIPASGKSYSGSVFQIYFSLCTPPHQLPS